MATKSKIILDNKNFVNDDNNDEDSDRNADIKDAENFKGIYFNENTEQHYYEGGAHFSYKVLYKKLSNLLLKQENSRQSMTKSNLSTSLKTSENNNSTKNTKDRETSVKSRNVKIDNNLTLNVKVKNFQINKNVNPKLTNNDIHLKMKKIEEFKNLRTISTNYTNKSKNITENKNTSLNKKPILNIAPDIKTRNKKTSIEKKIVSNHNSFVKSFSSSLNKNKLNNNLSKLIDKPKTHIIKVKENSKLKSIQSSNVSKKIKNVISSKFMSNNINSKLESSKRNKSQVINMNKSTSLGKQNYNKEKDIDSKYKSRNFSTISNTSKFTNTFKNASFYKSKYGRIDSFAKPEMNSLHNVPEKNFKTISNLKYNSIKPNISKNKNNVLTKSSLEKIIKKDDGNNINSKQFFKIDNGNKTTKYHSKNDSIGSQLTYSSMNRVKDNDKQKLKNKVISTITNK